MRAAAARMGWRAAAGARGGRTGRCMRLASDASTRGACFPSLACWLPACPPARPHSRLPNRLPTRPPTPTHPLTHPLAPAHQALALPKDWAVLYHTHGLRSFLAVPIGTANETLGLLTIAKQQPHAFDDEWCAARGCACRGKRGRQRLRQWHSVSLSGRGRAARTHACVHGCGCAPVRTLRHMRKTAA